MADIDTLNDLTGKQHKALLALLSEQTIRQAAEVAAVPERTLHRWLKEPLFDAAYRDARRLAVQHAITQGQQASGLMMRRLIHLAQHARSEAVQLGAARAVIEFAIKSVELEDLAARLVALEERYATNIR